MKTSKEKIIKTSTYFFLKKGYEGTSLADISSAVGIRKGSLFNHIKSKENLYQKVVSKELERDFVDIEKCSLHELMDIYLQRMYATIERLNGLFDPDICITDYMLFIMEAGKKYQPAKQKIIGNYEREIDCWKRCLQRAQENGEIKREVDVDFNAKLFHHIFYGQFYIQAINNELNFEQLKLMYYNLYYTLKE